MAAINTPYKQEQYGYLTEKVHLCELKQHFLASMGLHSLLEIKSSRDKMQCLRPYMHIYRKKMKTGVMRTTRAVLLYTSAWYHSRVLDH